MSYGTVVEGDALGRGNRQAGLGQQAQVGLMSAGPTSCSPHPFVTDIDRQGRILDASFFCIDEYPLFGKLSE